MRKIAVFLLLVLLLSALAVTVSATNVTAPPMPTVSLNSPQDTASLPANLGSIIGVVLAGLMVVAVIVIAILKKRK